MVTNKTRSLTTLVLLCIAALLFPACGQTPSASGAAELAIASNQSQFMWGIAVASSETAENLSSTQAYVQCGGNIEHVPYEEKPSDGNTFLLIEMTIEKQQAGAGKFEWDKLYVLDAQGNKFHRHPNDTFLENHNLKRIKSTDLTVGKNEGFVCFEISKASADGQLLLIYDAPEGENKTPLTLKENKQ